MTAQPNDYFTQFKPQNFKQAHAQFQSDIPELNSQDDKEFSFNEYKPDKYPEETKFDSLLRQSAQYSSRALERVGGFIPDAKKFVSDLVIQSYENAALDAIPTGKKQREAPEWLKGALENKPGMTGGISSGLTSPELREVSEEATQGYTKPRTHAEERIGTVIGDITSSLLGGNRSVKNNLLVPIGANLIEEGIDLLGFDKSKQTMGKLGGWLLLGSAANIDANKFATNLRDEVRDSLNPGTLANINKLGNELRPLDRKWLSGDARSQAARGQINDIITDLRQGKNQADDLIERIRAINAEIEMKGGFEYRSKTPKHVAEAEISNLNKVKKAVYNTLEESTKGQPGFFEKFMDSQTALAAISASNKLIEFAKRHSVKAVSGGLATILGSAYLDPTLTAVATPALLGLYKGGQVAIRMAKSPVLRKYYLNSLKAVGQNNVPVFIQSIEKLDRELEKEEKKQKIPYKFNTSDQRKNKSKI